MAVEDKYGEWAFLLGVILAVVVGLFSSQLGSNIIGIVYGVLVLLGLVVGFLNIREKEINSFLIAAIALLLAANSWQPVTDIFTTIMGEVGSALIVNWIRGFFGALVAFISPAAFIVALKAIYNLASCMK